MRVFETRDVSNAPKLRSLAMASGRQTLENRLAQFLRFAKKFLVFQKNTVQLERLIGTKLSPQHHIAHVHGIGQGRFFGKLFEGG